MPTETESRDNQRFMRRTLVVAGVLLALGALIWFAGQISGVLFMVFVAIFVAVAMEPPVHLLAKRGWKRGPATAVVFLGAAVLAVGFLVALAPLLIDQVGQIIVSIPGYVESVLEFFSNTFGIEFGPEVDADIENEASALSEWLAGNAGGVAGGLAALAGAIGGFFIFASTVAIFSFYMVAELPQLQRTVLTFMPEHRQREALHIWDVAVEKMGGYIYSRLILAFISGSIAAAFLAFLDVPFALSLGIWIGVLSQFIPVVGTYLALILPAIVALSSNGTTTMIWVIVFFVAYQQVENLLLSPRITKRTMSIHPAVSIAAIIIGGQLMGAIGIILALPMAGIIQALISESSRRHELFLDAESPPEDSVEPA
jgi:predicted PurR-regulated permease PerM